MINIAIDILINETRYINVYIITLNILKFCKVHVNV